MGIQKQNVCSFPEHLGLHNVFYILSNTDKVIFLISPTKYRLVFPAAQ